MPKSIDNLGLSDTAMIWLSIRISSVCDAFARQSGAYPNGLRQTCHALEALIHKALYEIKQKDELRETWLAANVPPETVSRDKKILDTLRPAVIPHEADPSHLVVRWIDNPEDVVEDAAEEKAKAALLGITHLTAAELSAALVQAISTKRWSRFPDNDGIQYALMDGDYLYLIGSYPSDGVAAVVSRGASVGLASSWQTFIDDPSMIQQLWNIVSANPLNKGGG